MQYMFLGIVFVSITSLAFVLMVALNRLVGGGKTLAWRSLILASFRPQWPDSKIAVA